MKSNRPDGGNSCDFKITPIRRSANNNNGAFVLSSLRHDAWCTWLLNKLPDIEMTLWVTFARINLSKTCERFWLTIQDDINNLEFCGSHLIITRWMLVCQQSDFVGFIFLTWYIATLCQWLLCVYIMHYCAHVYVSIYLISVYLYLLLYF